MRKPASALAAFLFVLWAIPAAAQETRGAVEGTIKDSSGGVLPGVTVQAAVKNGVTQNTVTDAKGVYHFPTLPPGSYTITATLSGFSAARSFFSSGSAARS